MSEGRRDRESLRFHSDSGQAGAASTGAQSAPGAAGVDSASVYKWCIARHSGARE